MNKKIYLFSIIFSVLIFSFSALLGLMLINKKSNNANLVSQTENNQLILYWNTNSTSSNPIVNAADENEVWTKQGNISISGGMKIYLDLTSTTEQNLNTIYFGSSENYAQANANGRRLTKITISAENGHDFIIEYNFDDATNEDAEFTSVTVKDHTIDITQDKLVDNKIEFTPEEIDVNYSGKITFKAEFTAINYVVKFYAYNESTSAYVEDQAMLVNINETMNVPTNCSLETTSKSFSGWWIKASSGYDENLETLTLSGTGADNKPYEYVFSTTENYIKDNEVYYLIKDVKGFGKLGQTEENPIIIARWSYRLEYDVLVNQGDVSLWTEYKKSNPLLSVEEVYGIENESFVIDYTSTQTFATNSGKAFDISGIKTEAGSNYYIYNYGSEITDWEIEISTKGANSGTDKIIQYFESDGFKTKIIEELTGNSNSTIFDISNFGNIADKLNKIATTAYEFSENPNSDGYILTMTPVWENVQINLQANGGTKTSNKTISYNGEYAFENFETDASSGKAIVNYTTISGNIVSIDGKWNYYKIPHSCYSHNEQENVYTIQLNSVELDNFYGVIMYLDGGKLDNCTANNSNPSRVTYQKYHLIKSNADLLEAFGENLVEYQSFNNYLKNSTASSLMEADNGYINGFLNDFVTKYSTGVETYKTHKIKYYGYRSSIDKYLLLFANGQSVSSFPSVTKSGKRFLGYTGSQNKKQVKYKVYTDSSLDNTWEGFKYDEVDTWYNTTNTNVPDLTALYDDQSYNLCFNTLTDGKISNNGYAMVNLDNSKYYVAQNSCLKETTSNLSTIDNVSFSSQTDYIIVNSGSTLTFSVRDQTKDTKAGLGSCSELLGYKFKDIQVEYSPLTEGEIVSLISGSGYGTYSFNASNLVKLINGSTITIKINFEKITYSILAEIDNISAGNVGFENSVANPIAVQLDSSILARYNANFGYEFADNAFIHRINKKDTVLATKESLFNSINGEYNQTCEIEITTDFLKNFYTLTKDLSLSNLGLGKVIVNTQLISFDVNFKLVQDENLTALENYEDGIFAGYSFNIKDEKSFQSLLNSKLTIDGKESDLLVNLNKNQDEYNWLVQLPKGDNYDYYAMLNSRLYLPRNPKSTIDNYYTSYSFILDENTETSQLALGSIKYEIKNISDSLFKQMLTNNYSNGGIVATTDRNLFVMLEVRPIHEITIYAKSTNPQKDTNSTEKQISISQNETVVATTTIPNGANFVSIEESDSVFYADASNTAYVLKVLTYTGLENNLIANYDALRYARVDFRASTVGQDVLTSVKLEQDATLFAEFVPKALKLNLTYYLNGENSTLTEIQEYADINSISDVLNKDYYINDDFGFSYSLLNSEYELKVEINGNSLSPVYEDELFKVSYVLSDADFNFENLDVKIYVKKLNANEVIAKFVLKDVSQKAPTDDYGSIEIKYDQNSSLTGSAIVTENSVLSFVLNLNKGYDIVEYKFGTNSTKSWSQIKNYNAETKTLSITDSYNPNLHKGEYIFYVKKQQVQINLDHSNSNYSNKLQSYYIKANSGSSYGRYSLSGLFLGQSVTLIANPPQTERLDYFYYINNGVETKLDTNSFTILSEHLIQKTGTVWQVDLGYKVVEKFTLNINVEKPDFVNNVEIATSVNGNNYSVGSYLDKNSVVDIKITNPEFEKLNMYVNNVLCEIDAYNSVITLNENKIVNVRIEAKHFGVNVKEMAKLTIDDLSGVGKEITTGAINDMQTSGQAYKDVAVISFVYENEDRILTNLKISNNDNKTYILTIENNEIFITDENGDVDLADFIQVYNLSINTETKKISMSYETKNSISFELTYTAYKLIQPID